MKFWDFSAKLFEQQKKFFDVHVVHENRNDTYKRLAKIADGVGVNEKDIFELLEVSDSEGPDGSANVGNKVTDDIKLMVKVSFRQGHWCGKRFRHCKMSLTFIRRRIVLLVFMSHPPFFLM